MLDPEALTVDMVACAAAIVASTACEAVYVWRARDVRPYATSAPPPILYVRVASLDGAGLAPLRTRLQQLGMGSGLLAEPA